MLDNSCPQHMTTSDQGRNRSEDRSLKQPEEEQVEVEQKEIRYV